MGAKCHDLNNLSVRRPMTIAQKLPEEFDEKLIQFQQLILKMRKLQGYRLSMIGNADQTSSTFDMPSYQTLSIVGNMTVSIFTTGHGRLRLTVMHACMACGSKLKTDIIIKQETLPKGMTLRNNVIVRTHPKRWMK
ncbi:hypothetical protein HZS_6004 [Henneguya salminicola]|nr:hypothetical protein HZS_6004 [Henneguya salminicola]